MQVYRRGDSGPAVAEIRAALGRLALLPDDGSDVFDEACDRAVRGFQQRRGLRVDGRVGEETYRALDEARWRLGDRLLSYRVSAPFVGDDVVALQRRLLQLGFDPGRCDGIFGQHTAGALVDLQRQLGLVPDGTCGPATLSALARLSRTVVGGSAERVRDEVRLALSGPALAGKVVVIDPAHGGEDRGASANGLVEAEVVADIAARVEGRLGAVGVLAFLSRGPESAPDDEERAAFANSAEADLFMSLHVDGAPSPDCNGIASYFYGAVGEDGEWVSMSAAGARLADLVQTELVARTDLLDCRAHPKTWTLLRLTRMPAVRVELGYLTNPGDAARLASSQFRDAVAEGLVAAIARLFLPEEDAGSMTGQLRIPAAS